LRMEFSNDGIRDSLTGLMAPSLFYESADRLRSWADRKGESLALIAIDAENCDADQLISVARGMTAELRGGDLLTRIGQQKFALLLLGDRSSAGHVIFRLENTIKPRLSFRSIELDQGESIASALNRLNI
ncbi:MAG: hypothetical protein EB029_03095, partial [Actinobacteria bacterium]|nr:hypothetical protein [Actinomycetota bacterium]